MKFRSVIRREVNAGSMADIAFLLLIFFLVTTQIQSEKGLKMRLPPKDNEPVVQRINDRNIYKILINSEDKLLVEGEPWEEGQALTPEIVKFIMNNGVDEELSDSPSEAVVSIKTDRGTSYKQFMRVLDQVQGAYYHLRAESLNLTAEEYRSLDISDPVENTLYQKGRENFPMQISIAEPTNTEN